MEEDVTQPLATKVAITLLRRLMNEGNFRYSSHARKRMSERKVLQQDVENVLNGGWIYDPPELENGSWRYTVCTNRYKVVIAFTGGRLVVVVVTVLI